MDTSIAKDDFARNLRSMARSGVLGSEMVLFERFFEYFADCLADVCQEDKVTATGYFWLIEKAIFKLREQNCDEEDEKLRLLAHTLRGTNEMEQRIKELFFREDVVTGLTSADFLKDLSNIWD